MAKDQLFEDYLDLGLFEGQQLLVLDLDKCTRCDECVRACSDSHGGITRVVRDGPRFEQFLVALSCRSCHDPQCLEGCPVDAIHRKGFGLEIQIDSHCIGCSLCATNCPFGSIHMVRVEGDAMEEVPREEWWTLPGRSHETHPEGTTVKASLKHRATNCDLCAGSWTGPRCVHACPHDAAHRMPGEEILELAKRRRQLDDEPVGVFSWLTSLLRPLAPGE